MKLEGSLDAFGLPDVCTLLASTGKSGVLELSRTRADGPVHGSVWFSSGQICGASADTNRQNLVRRIIGTGAVDDMALRHAVARTVSGGTGVARALLESGAVDAQVVQSAAHGQITDAMSELLTWSEGDFAFNVDLTYNDDVGVQVTVVDALSLARERQGQWNALRGTVAGPDVVLIIAPGVGADPTVSRDEWAVLALVDGHRSVQDLAELTGTGLYGVTALLSGLLQRGLLAVKDATSPDYVSNLERRLGMLMSIEGGAPSPRPTVVQMASAPIPGGLGVTTAAALIGDSSGDLPRSPRGSDSAPAMSDDEAIPPEPSTASPTGLGASLSLAMPGGLGTQVVAAHAQTMSHSDYEGAVSMTATAPANYAAELIKRDPMMNRTLLLRLIAGVRGL